MLKSKFIRNKAIKIFALTLSFTTVANSFVSVSAHPNNTYRDNNSLYLGDNSFKSLQAQSLRLLDDDWNPRRNIRRRNRRNERFYRDLSSGTRIRTKYRNARKILVARDEVAPLILEVARHVRDKSGRIVIPRGSEIIGEIRPARRDGSRFVAESIVFPNGDEYLIAARSRIIYRTENYRRDDRYTNDTWQSTAASVVAAAIIGGIVRDQGLNSRSIFGDTIERVIRGRDDRRRDPLSRVFDRRDDRYYDDRYDDRYYDYDLISINPDKDLDLTLTQDFYFDDFYRDY